MKDIIFLTPIVIAIAATVLIIALYNFRLKKKIIDAGPIDDNALKFLKSLSGLESEAFKWGIILFFSGLGLIVIEFLPFEASRSSLPYGVEMIFISLGFLIYYVFIGKKNSSK